MNTKRFKKAGTVCLGVLICISSAISFPGCENKETPKNSSVGSSSAEGQNKSTADEPNAVGTLEQLGIDAEMMGIKPNVLRDTKNTVGFQLDMPNEGDTIAVIHTSLGDITLRLFPDQAPKTVTNFLTLASEGKYSNTAFHKVVDGNMIQGGHIGEDTNNPNGVSSYGVPFEDEFCDKLFNIRGSVAMVSSGADTNGSQFIINQAGVSSFKDNGGWVELDSKWKEAQKQLSNYKDSDFLSAYIEQNSVNCYDTDIVSQEIRDLYSKNGGNPEYDGAYNAVDRGNTVFAQVIDGMNVVDKIAKVKTDKDKKPENAVLIESIEAKKYSADKTKTSMPAE